MKTSIAALIISIIVALAPHTQSSAGCVVSGSDVVSALVEAQAGSRCLEIPQGVYSISPSAGDWLSVTVPNVEIKGAGVGKTIIQTTGITLTNNLYLIALRAPGGHVHDLSLVIGTGYHSTYEVGGILAGVGALHSTIERVEVSGGYTGSGGNGFGIGMYQPWDQGGGSQYNTIQNNYVHDSPATGIGVNGNANLLLNNHIKNVGTTGLQHGFYAQGGGNLYQGNVIENASGWSFHGHKQVPSLDGSGDRYIGNLSLNPGTGGIVINTAWSGATQLTRYATISGNTFRNTAGKRSGGIWCNGVPCVIDANILEDTFVTNGSGWIEDSGGSVITGNLLTTSGTAPDGAVNYNMIKVSGTVGATVANNRMVNGFYGGGIVAVGARHSIMGNTVLMMSGGTQALILGGDGLLVQGNRLESTAGAYVLGFSGAPTNLTLTGNYFKRATTLGALFNVSLTGVTGVISSNLYDGQPYWTGNGAGVLR